MRGAATIRITRLVAITGGIAASMGHFADAVEVAPVNALPELFRRLRLGLEPAETHPTEKNISSPTVIVAAKTCAVVVDAATTLELRRYTSRSVTTMWTGALVRRLCLQRAVSQ